MLIAIGIGAAANAIWFDVRFPSLAPRDLKYGILHLAAAMIFAHSAVPLALDLAGQSLTVVLAAVFAVAFPALAYVFLAGFWMLKLTQSLMAGLR
jgi:hypothetical protein